MSLNILITGVGGPTPRSFARSIKEIGGYKTAKIVATDIHPYAIGLYQDQLFDKCYITPRSSDQDYWKVMDKIIQEEKIDIAVILPEQEVLAWSGRQAREVLPCKALIPHLAAVHKLLDKGVLSNLLEGSGLVPRSVILRPDDERLKENTESVLSYPYWIRSSTGSSGLGSYKIEGFEDLRQWIWINKDIQRFIASEYLPGRNLACKLLYYKGKLIRAACAERVQYIMAKIAPSGITGNTSFGRLINDMKVFEAGKKAMENVFEKTGAEKHGFFTVDMKEDQAGNPLITEINVRHVAFTQCLAMGGANLCEDTIRLLTEDSGFDREFRLYNFQEGLIFLRDVDERPVLMHEKELLLNTGL